MKKQLMLAAAALAYAVAIPAANAQAPGIHRTDLVKNDLSAPQLEAVQVRVDFEPGAFAPKHVHPGEEIAHVLEGTLEYQLGDQPPVTLKTGQALFIPAGMPHSARNVGGTKAAELATYVVKKGAPLATPAK